ncbi:MAG: XRE family transcriptional regulator [Candidatus Electrothrix sp. AUS1_2]|nr:XRE family transcriptional regulator [Candidatus Electrothrix sp. AUS1_2]
MKPQELKKKRLEFGLTQKQLAGRLKTPYVTYSNWERGIRRIPGLLEVALKQVSTELRKG